MLPFSWRWTARTLSGVKGGISPIHGYSTRSLHLLKLKGIRNLYAARLLFWHIKMDRPNLLAGNRKVPVHRAVLERFAPSLGRLFEEGGQKVTLHFGLN